MIPAEAQTIVQKLLDPLPLDSFLDDVLGYHYLRLEGDRNSARTALLGADPARVLLEGFDRLAPDINYHAVDPTGAAPAVERVASADDFEQKIRIFHDGGWTVRLSNISGVSGELDRLTRAMECLFHQPVKPMAFWSRSEGRGPAHHDDMDLICIQLVGRKRWLVSTEPAELPNAWQSIPKGPTRFGRHDTFEVGPGDLLYMPRGTTHATEALEESIHVSIGFTPLTLREALIACVDQMSDLDRPLRRTVGARLAHQARRADFADMLGPVRENLERLAAATRSDAFIADALQRRSARAVGDMRKLNKPAQTPALTPSTRLRHNPLAMAHLTGNAEKIDFAYPGGHQYVHRGVEQGLLFIANTPEFKVADIPGGFGDDVRLALANQFVSCGFLEVIEP
jgi:hypothetical protein